MNDKTEQKSEQVSEPVTKEKTEQPAAKKAESDKLQDQLDTWQTKIDEAKLQMHLGAKEVEQEPQPHAEKLENEFAKAKDQWEKLENASDNAWDDIQSGFSKSVKSMQMAFEKAKSHFPDEEKK